MKVGDLIRPIIPLDAMGLHPFIQPYLLQVIEIAKTGFSAIILSGPHMGRQHFYPQSDSREWEIINENR